MRESQTLALELENPRLKRLAEPGVAASAECRFHQSDGRLGERRDSAGDLERRSAEAGEARVQESVEVGRDRKLLAGSERAAPPLERGCELEREEWVAARGFPESDQRRPWERRVEAGA